MLAATLCMGRKSFDDIHISFCLSNTSGIPGCTCDVEKIHSVVNSANGAFANFGPLSVHRDSGIPCSVNNTFIIDTVFAALHWDAGIL